MKLIYRGAPYSAGTASKTTVIECETEYESVYRGVRKYQKIMSGFHIQKVPQPLTYRGATYLSYLAVSEPSRCPSDSHYSGQLASIA
jgi:hypothetical protein